MNSLFFSPCIFIRVNSISMKKKKSPFAEKFSLNVIPAVTIKSFISNLYFSEWWNKACTQHTNPKWNKSHSRKRNIIKWKKDYIREKNLKIQRYSFERKTILSIFLLHFFRLSSFIASIYYTKRMVQSKYFEREGKKSFPKK